MVVEVLVMTLSCVQRVFSSCSRIYWPDETPVFLSTLRSATNEDITCIDSNKLEIRIPNHNEKIIYIKRNQPKNIKNSRKFENSRRSDPFYGLYTCTNIAYLEVLTMQLNFFMTEASTIQKPVH